MKIQKAGKEYFDEIFRIGGNPNNYDTYVALINDKRVGFFGEKKVKYMN